MWPDVSTAGRVRAISADEKHEQPKAADVRQLRGARELHCTLDS